MAVRLDLTDEEASFVAEVLQAWEDGLEDAKECTTEDVTMPSVDKLLEIVGDYDQQQRHIDNVLGKLGTR